MTVTVVGWAASTPREVHGDGVPYTSFRLATTPRWYDGKLGRWVDGRTEWITVKAFRDVAFNVAASVRKGDPLVVTGRMRTEEWTSEGVVRTGLVLDVSALGHDLTRGTSTFARRVHVQGDRVAEHGSGHGTEDGGEAPVERLRADDAPEDPWVTDVVGAAGEVGPDGGADDGAEGAGDGAHGAAAGPGGGGHEPSDGGVVARRGTRGKALTGTP
ncbi:single-stranded DNA-binding protein [Cellulomonas carbonis T26]|uniref:Single-stranded DNA-binding protein n=1 Tax=Cellulomonas carbonis T26 TaxID=947969 RepID=A0A0A0BMM1_9CELL|nr:single-stranded DNA-binding protein [Cellulomonas carbonis T26]